MHRRGTCARDVHRNRVDSCRVRGLLLPQTMRTRVTALIVFFGAVLSAPQTVHGADAYPGSSCPGYRAALQAARGALVRGARTEAVLALERAKAALADCQQRDTGRATRVATRLDGARARL